VAREAAGTQHAPTRQATRARERDGGDTAALELALQIADNSPVAVRAAKRAIRHGWGVGLDAAIDIEDAAWRTAAGSACAAAPSRPGRNVSMAPSIPLEGVNGAIDSLTRPVSLGG
jgi:hypothetical protein